MMIQENSKCYRELLSSIFSLSFYCYDHVGYFYLLQCELQAFDNWSQEIIISFINELLECGRRVETYCIGGLSTRHASKEVNYSSILTSNKNLVCGKLLRYAIMCQFVGKKTRDRQVMFLNLTCRRQTDHSIKKLFIRTYMILTFD